MHQIAIKIPLLASFTDLLRYYSVQMRYYSVKPDGLLQMFFRICIGNISKVLPLY